MLGVGLRECNCHPMSWDAGGSNTDLGRRRRETQGMECSDGRRTFWMKLPALVAPERRQVALTSTMVGRFGGGQGAIVWTGPQTGPGARRTGGSLAWSPDGKRLFGGEFGQVWDRDTGDILARMGPQHRCCDWSPTVNDDFGYRHWADRIQRRFPEASNWPIRGRSFWWTSLAWSVNGALFASPEGVLPYRFFERGEVSRQEQNLLIYAGSWMGAEFAVVVDGGKVEAYSRRPGESALCQRGIEESFADCGHLMASDLRSSAPAPSRCSTRPANRYEACATAAKARPNSPGIGNPGKLAVWKRGNR